MSRSMKVSPDHETLLTFWASSDALLNRSSSFEPLYNHLTTLIQLYNSKLAFFNFGYSLVVRWWRILVPGVGNLLDKVMKVGGRTVLHSSHSPDSLPVTADNAGTKLGHWAFNFSKVSIMTKRGDPFRHRNTWLIENWPSLLTRLASYCTRWGQLRGSSQITVTGAI